MRYAYLRAGFQLIRLKKKCIHTHFAREPFCKANLPAESCVSLGEIFLIGNFG